MARLISAALLLSTLTAHAAHAQEQPLDDDTIAAANDAGVDPTKLAGALNTLRSAGYANVTPRQYLIAEGDLAQPPAPVALGCGLPICGPLGARLLCIEGFESHHNGAAINRSSGAAGWLQWLPSTARAWGVQIGNRASEWAGAARIAALGERYFTSQWTTLQRGLC